MNRLMGGAILGTSFGGKDGANSGNAYGFISMSKNVNES